MRIVFIGPPGAGKGTQSKRLAQHLSVSHVSTGEILRDAREQQTPEGRLAAEYLDAGRLVPDEVIVWIVEDRLQQLENEKGWLLDGFPRTLEQAHSLDRFLEVRETPLQHVVELQVPEEELLQRLTSRGRSDDKLDTIRRRLDDFQAITQPLSAYYEQRGLLKAVDGRGALDVVLDRIVQAIGYKPES